MLTLASCYTVASCSLQHHAHQCIVLTVASCSLLHHATLLHQCSLLHQCPLLLDAHCCIMSRHCSMLHHCIMLTIASCYIETHIDKGNGKKKKTLCLGNGKKKHCAWARGKKKSKVGIHQAKLQHDHTETASNQVAQGAGPSQQVMICSIPLDTISGDQNLYAACKLIMPNRKSQTASTIAKCDRRQTASYL